jgi:hypothetical protein
MPRDEGDKELIQFAAEVRVDRPMDVNRVGQPFAERQIGEAPLIIPQLHDSRRYPTRRGASRSESPLPGSE